MTGLPEASAAGELAPALMAGLLASLACGVVGSLVLVRRASSVAGGLSHAALGGVGLAWFVGLSPLAGALGFAVLCGAVLAEAEHRKLAGFDTLVSMTWAGGMALGVLLLSLAPEQHGELEEYLFGSVSLASGAHLWLLAALDAVVLGVVWWRFAPLRAMAFDVEFARASGLPVRLMRHMLMALTALAVVAVVRVVGIVLAIALLTVPAATARRRTDDLARMMLLATVLCAVITCGGLVLSVQLSQLLRVDLPDGPVVVMLSLLVHGLERLLPGSRSGR
ncbi:MAG: metal ABC transporter permease [Planctomycetota bacterium]|nr:MAG: metal ABC transporter permease [Planctomycetota bacterium]